MSTFPTSLQTARLDLRQFKHEDWTALHEHYGDAECTRFTFKRALTEGESWRAMCSMVGHWAIRGYGPFAAVERETGLVIGAIGLWYPNDWPEPEIKWALSRRFWGKGYASEAVRAIQLPACRHLGGKAPISFMDATNEASIRLAASVGAVFEKTAEFRGSAWQMYRHPGGT
ncbi:MAG: GNAT family N-acetyltransferase [Pseudomonadota bacterium]